MKTCEAHLVFNFRVASTSDKHLHYFDHISLACQMHRRIEASVFIVLNVAVSSVLNKHFNQRLVFGFNGELFLARRLTWSGVWPLMFLQLTSTSLSERSAIASWMLPWLIAWNMIELPTCLMRPIIYFNYYKIISLLFLATLFALLLLAAGLEPVSLPHFQDMLVVLFLCYLFRRRQDLHNFGVTKLVSPVACSETLCVLNIFNVLRAVL